MLTTAYAGGGSGNARWALHSVHGGDYELSTMWAPGRHRAAVVYELRRGLDHRPERRSLADEAATARSDRRAHRRDGSGPYCARLVLLGGRGRRDPPLRARDPRSRCIDVPTFPGRGTAVLDLVLPRPPQRGTVGPAAAFSVLVDRRLVRASHLPLVSVPDRQ